MQRKKKTKNFELILVYPNSKRDFKRGMVPYSHIVIQIALRQIGIEPRMIDINDIEKIEVLRKDISSPQIWGVGSNSETYEQTRYLCESIKAVDPDRRFIVLGGPITESTLFNGAYLINGWIDAINYGHAKPFIDFISAIIDMGFDEQRCRIFAEKSALATKGKHEVPFGRFPKLETISLSIVAAENTLKKEFHLCIPPYDTCRNKCKYCTTPCSRMPDLTNKVVKAVQDIVTQKEQKITHMYYVNSTFTDKVSGQMKKVYDVAGDKKIKTSLTLGGECFTDERYDKTIKLLREMNVHAATLAVDCVDEEVAHAIGRKYENKIRHAEMLSKEQAGIIRFLRSNQDWILQGERMYLQVNMILSPFDTPGSMQKVIDFFGKIVAAQKSNAKIDIHFVLFGIVPYPSSQLFKECYKYIHLTNLIKNPPSQNIISYNTEIWKFPQVMYGISFIKIFRILYNVVGRIIYERDYIANGSISQKKKNKEIGNYLLIESLSMTKQYLAGVQRFEDMQITRMPYKENAKDVRKLYDALVGQQ